MVATQQRRFAILELLGTFSPLFVGAWLLLAKFTDARIETVFFQSPFRRGNGCYKDSDAQQMRQRSFQSPFRRGNGCYQLQISEY